MYKNQLQLLKSFGAIAILVVAIAVAQLHLVSAARATDWMTWPSTYTHDAQGARVDQHSLPVQPVGPNRNDVVRSGYRHFRSTLQAGQSADNYHVTEQWGEPVVPYEHWRFPFRPFGVPYDAWGPPPPNGVFLGTGLNVPFWPPFHGHGGNAQGMNGQGMNGQGMNGQGMNGQGMNGQGMNGQGMNGSHWPGYGPGPGPGPGFGPGTGQWPNPWQGFGPGGWGFPLQPRYQNQPWFDGTYPDAPPLDNRSDREFFWKPGMQGQQN